MTNCTRVQRSKRQNLTNAQITQECGDQAESVERNAFEYRSNKHDLMLSPANGKYVSMPKICCSTLKLRI